MTDLINLFSLHGTYFRNDENRLTGNTIFLLSENRRTFLRSFLAELGFNCTNAQLASAKVDFQRRDDLGIPDAEIIVDEDIHIVIEAKIGKRRLGNEQIERYADYLATKKATSKKLVCITQLNDLKRFNAIKSKIKLKSLPASSFKYLQWHQVLDILQRSIGINNESHIMLDKAIRKGKQIRYAERIASQFIRELENTMYDKKIVDQLTCKIDDVSIATQEPWYMKVALKQRVWFPSSRLPYGRQPSKYVAYYETDREGNKNRKTITYIAKNLIYWNRITYSDARQQQELKHLFSDKDIDKVIAKWRFDEDTFHIVLTDKPVKLARPIPLGIRNLARTLAKRKCSFAELLSAKSIDDLV